MDWIPARNIRQAPTTVAGWRALAKTGLTLKVPPPPASPTLPSPTWAGSGYTHVVRSPSMR